MTSIIDSQVQRLIDRAAITDLLVRCCHAIDRLDRPLLESVYWPDATDDHVTYKGNAAGFIAWVMEFLRPIKTQHFVGNCWINFDSTTRAQGETYVVALHQIEATFGVEEMTVGGRYLDHFEKRGDEWRLSDRTLAIDYSRIAAASDIRRYDGTPNLGGRAPDDPFYRLFSMSGSDV